MKALTASVVLALISTLWQPDASAVRVAIVIDATAETIDGAESARVRQRSLGRLDAAAQPVYFELTQDAIRRVPDGEREDFRRTTFTVAPPRYNGVTLTVGEAVEILRGNESRRDAIIARECRTLPNCGPLVAVAATQRATGADDGARQKLRRIVDVARSTRATTLVVVTAGWPYRDAGRAGVAEAARDLRSTGVHLIVLRLAGRERFEGLLKDAGETVASQLSGDVVPVETDDQGARADERFGAAFPPERIAALPAAAAVAADTTRTPSPVIDADVSEPQTTDDAAPLVTGLPADLVRTAAYVDRFERTFSSVIWHERSVQEARIDRKFGTSGGRFSALAARRTLDSEFFFLWLPRDASWIAVRDVIAIDGTPRDANDRRLQPLLRDRSASAASLRTLAAENGRFDVGTIKRTFTEPTLVLLFLDAHYRQRFAFAKRETGTARGRHVATYDFVERARPTVIKNGEADLPASGSLTMDVETGEVLDTRLVLRSPAAMLQGEVTVRFGSHPRFDILVPLEARESYASPTERVTATAAYSEFRRFETAGRIVP